MNITAVAEGSEKNDYTVEGYASTYEPYKLLTIDGVDYYERIEPTAFDDSDMDDVVFRVDQKDFAHA